MKILHLIYDHINNPWVAGGGAVRVYEIYRRISQRHKITVVCGKYPNAVDYEEGDLRFHFVGSRVNNYVLSTFSYALGAALFLKTNKDYFDAVIEDFAPYNPVFSFLFKKDAVLQLHQKEGLHLVKKYFIFGALFLLIEDRYHNFFRNLIVLSRACAEKFNLANRAAVVSNGFDQTLLRQENTEGDYILFLGRMHIDSKGLDILCEALKYLRRKVNLVIAGAGIDSDKVSEIFKCYIDAGQVKMIGFISGRKKADILSRCKFMLMPSRYEAQGITLLEAAACGRPAIISNIPELRYALDAGFAISFKRNDPRDLAEKIDFLLNQDSLRNEMGRKGRVYSREYTWDKIAIQYENILGDFSRGNVENPIREAYR